MNATARGKNAVALCTIRATQTIIDYLEQQPRNSRDRQMDGLLTKRFLKELRQRLLVKLSETTA